MFALFSDPLFALPVPRRRRLRDALARFTFGR
jgi:hypothetical protein